MKEKKTLIYQLLSAALLVVLIYTVWNRDRAVENAGNKTTEKQEEVTEAQTNEVKNGWRRISPSEIRDNPIVLVDNYKGLLAMGNKEEHNAMTIGWGTLGVLWRTSVFTAFVSSSRYSHQLMEKNDYYTVSFLNKSHFDDVMLLGRTSGRDGDKIGKTSLTLDYTELGNPMFREAFMVIECRKIYGAPFDKERFGDIPQKLYEEIKIGVHSEYVGEIVNVFVNDANR